MADEKEPIQSVQVFGRKKTATAVAYCKRGKGLIKVNGRPLELVEPRALSYKLQEPILLLGKDRFARARSSCRCTCCRPRRRRCSRRDLRRPPPRRLPLRRQPPRLCWHQPPRLCRLPLPRWSRR